MSAYLSWALAAALLGPSPRGVEAVPPPLPSQGGSLDAWASGAGHVHASLQRWTPGLAAESCIDRAVDRTADDACKQNVMAESDACSQQTVDDSLHLHARDRMLRYEACMDASLFGNGCARKTRERFWTEALHDASSKVPLAWSAGWTCKDKNRTEDVVFNSFWGALCQRNASKACFPPSNKTKTSLLRVSSQRHEAGHKVAAYHRWLRRMLAEAVGMPSTCRSRSLLQRISLRRAEATASRGRKLVWRLRGRATIPIVDRSEGTP